MTLGTFTAEIWTGSSWVDLNDVTNYQITGEFRTQSQVQQRRVTASSLVVEGEYTVHAVRSNVEETVGVWVRGASQYDVSTNLADLETWFSQSSFQLRFQFGNSRETWDCFTADYTIGRGQAFAHNGMATFTAQVPRLPTTTYEVF